MRPYTLEPFVEGLRAGFVVRASDGLNVPYAKSLTEMHAWLVDQFGEAGPRWTMGVLQRGSREPFSTEIAFPRKGDATAFRLRWQ